MYRHYDSAQPAAPRTGYLTPASGLRRYLDPGADSLLQGRYVRNHADQLAVPVQTYKGFQGSIEDFLIKRAEALIQEKRIHPNILADHVGGYR